MKKLVFNETQKIWTEIAWMKMQRNRQILDESRRKWTEIAQHKNPGELTLEIEVYKKMIDIFQVGDYYYSIFNVPETRIEYVSDSVMEVLGYRPDELGLEYMFEMTHPDDLPYFVDFESTVTNFFDQLPVDKIMKYKTRYDFRIKNSKGEYLRILHQAMVIQSDKDGALLRALLVHTDISHLKKDNKMTLSFIGMDGEPSYIDVQPLHKFSPSKELFTAREKEILYLLAQNKQTEEIAEALFISPSTVSTHRKNMFAKANVHSALELITLALQKGWI